MKYLQLGIWHAKGFQHKKHLLTATTTDLGIGLNGKMVLYLEDLANPKNVLILVPNPIARICNPCQQKKSQTQLNLGFLI